MIASKNTLLPITKQTWKANRRLWVIVFAASLTIVVLRKNWSDKFQHPANQNHHKNREPPERKTGTKFLWSNEHNLWTLRDQDDDGDTRAKLLSLWPEESPSDRVVDQLRLREESVRVFKIKPPTDQYYPPGREIFQDCPVRRCEISYDKDEADALVFLNSDVIEEPRKERRINQIWVAYLLESPLNTYDKKFVRLRRGNHEFNWTASYRSDSDIVTPYSKFVPFSSQLQNYIKLKSIRTVSDRRSLLNDFQQFKPNKIGAGKIAWLVSNCRASNNRLEYARELSNHFQVDIYGKCGNLTCQKWNETGCFEMINRNYKFYLSFENSNCRQYLTEKLFKNALGYNDANYQVVPIVMGAKREDYERFAPPASFIHVEDFNSPKDLAMYLKLLDNDQQLYQSYFQWKEVGRFIDTKFMCRLCGMLHFADKHQVYKSYEDIKKWWLNYQQNKVLEESCSER